MSKIKLTLNLYEAQHLLALVQQSYLDAAKEGGDYRMYLDQGLEDLLSEAVIEDDPDLKDVTLGVYDRRLSDPRLYRVLEKLGGDEYACQVYGCYPDGSLKVYAQNRDWRIAGDGTILSQPFDWDQFYENKALDEFDARNRDMYENPGSYFEDDDPRRAW